MASATTNRPEALRERDVNRYYQPYKNTQAQNDAQLPRITAQNPVTPGEWKEQLTAHHPLHSADRALTAFAQLATLRLDVRRCLISLVDSRYQYVLTEATKTLSLSRHTVDKEDDRVWLGKSILDVRKSLCHYIFGTRYTATDPDGSTYTGDGMVVEDMRELDEFKDRPFVTGAPHVIFYAAVPIWSKSGYIIGTYACSDSVPRPGGLSIAEFRFMQDMAETVMEHLEMIRDREDRTKGERMVRGLSEFIEGSCALGKPANLESTKQRGIPANIGNATDEGKENVAPSANGTVSSVLKRQTENLHSMAEEDMNSPSVNNDGFDLAPLERKISRGSGRRIVQPPPSNPNCIFYRAADIIRKSTLADGAIFFRSTGPNIANKSPPNPADDSSMDESQSQSYTSGSEQPNGLAAFQREHPHHRKQKQLKQKPVIKDKESQDVKTCEVLGLSLVEEVLDDSGIQMSDLKFSEKSMEKYIRKFPYGKFFSFTETGSGLSSGETESEVELKSNGISATTSGHKTNGDAIPKQHTKNKRSKFIPTEILKVLPQVRTLIFLPLWDSAAERWIAGGFIWSNNPAALLSPENELPYLKAFGNSITSEYARMNALISDRAKSDFISSISHETRSPLHGILGSTEFLSDTELTQYQQGLVASVETCAKTLLDTLEHILDYAKINKLYNRDRNTRRLESRLKKKDTENSIMGPTADIDLHQMLEEVVEAVCSGHAFRETHSGNGFASENQKTSEASNLSHLAVSLEIAPKLQSLVRTQPGAIRRIIMNLLGNSLKYTNEGFVAVKMKGQAVAGDPSRVEVVLTFSDSGKGMSVEYQKTRLFSPFSQEDPFADGTGLGLSIVRQIVDSLGGQLLITSTKTVGTTVEVLLTLNVAGEQPDELEDVFALTRGKRIGMANPDCCVGNLDACVHAFNNNTAVWFDVEQTVVRGDYRNADVDGLMCHESSSNFHELAVGSKPLLVVCNNQSNQVALRRRLMTTLPACSRSNVHIIAQPLGPRKLANAFKYMFSPRSKPSTPGEELPSPCSGPVVGMEPNDHKAEVVDEFNPPIRRPSDAPSPAPPASPAIRPNGAMEKKVSFKEGIERAQTFPTPTAAASKEQQDEGQRPIPLRLKSGLGHDNPPAAHHVLLVDDNAINLQLLVMFMRKIKLPHMSASDGLQALEKYKSCVNSDSSSPTSEDSTSPGCFTYVLMDISMPVMDGLESTRRIRDFERETGTKRAIIVALTGLASADAQQAALDAGVDFYLPKPVRFADLKRLMDV